MCVEGDFFFKINKRDSKFIREMRVHVPACIDNIHALCNN